MTSMTRLVGALFVGGSVHLLGTRPTENPNARSRGCGATLPSDRRSGASSLGSTFPGGVLRPPWPFSSSSVHGRALCDGPLGHGPPSWCILTRQIDGRGALVLMLKLIAKYIR